MSCSGTAQRSSGGGPCVLPDGGRSGSITPCAVFACRVCLPAPLQCVVSVQDHQRGREGNKVPDLGHGRPREGVCVCRVQHVVCFLQALFVDGVSPLCWCACVAVVAMTPVPKPSTDVLPWRRRCHHRVRHHASEHLRHTAGAMVGRRQCMPRITCRAVCVSALVPTTVLCPPCCRQSWVKELHNMGPENIVLVLVGNKCDLESERVRQPCRWCCHFCYRQCAAADDDTTPSVTAVAPGGCGTDGCAWCCCCCSTRRPA